MVFKRYIKRDGKLFGPYYYESYRDKNGLVRKKYIGTSFSDKKIAHKSVTPRKKIVKNFDLNSRMALLFFGLSAMVLILVIGSVVYFSDKSVTGFVIDESGNIHYGNIENESVVQSFDSPKIDLAIKEPVRFEGQAISENKNKRMDFDTPDGNIRLYFDLLNYSEFVENLNDEINIEVNITEENITQEINITEINLTEVNITEEVNVTANLTETNVTEINITIPSNASLVVNETLPESNATINVTVPETSETTNQTSPIINNTDNVGGGSGEETIEQPVPEEQTSAAQTPAEQVPEESNPQTEQPIEQPLEQSVPQTEQPIEQPLEQSVPQTEQPPEQPSEQSSSEQPPSEGQGITGGIIRIFGMPFRLIQGLLSLTGRVVGIGNEISEINESVQLNQSPGNVIQEINITKVKEKAENLSSNEIKEIADNSVISADDFEINITETPQESLKYKWGYKFKLNDLKFIAKIDVTSNQSISKYDEHTLQIGNNLLSFKDLVDRGYIVRIDMPSLEMNLSFGVANGIISEVVCTENCSVTETNGTSNIIEVNITTPENVTETNIINATEQNLTEENITEPIVNVIINETVPEVPENISEQPEENQTPEQEQPLASEKETKKDEKQEQKEEKKEEKKQEKESKKETGITGNIIKIFALPFGLVGRVVEEVGNVTETVTQTIAETITGNSSQAAIIIPDIEYNYTVSIYIERDFSRYVNSSINKSNLIGAISNINASENISENVNTTEVLQTTENITSYLINNIIISNENNSNEIESCYDNETQILTESGWKYFNELENEKVATLNNKTGKMEWQQPTEKQIYDNNGDMYKIELDDGSELVVSKEHRVYSKSMPNDLSSSTSSLVLNTLVNDCLLKCSSLDQIGTALESANAKYDVSSLSEIEEFACSRKDSNEFSGTKDILSFINLSNSSISSEDKELNFRILGLCSFNSSSNCSGEYNFNPFKNKIFLVIPNPVNPVNTIPASITSSIYFNEGYDFFNLSCIDLLTFLANSSASFSVNLDLETNSWNLSYPSVSPTLLANASLATSDQLITLNASIFFFNSSGIDIVKCSILNLSCVSKTQKTQQIQVFKDFGLQKITDVYSSLQLGNEIYFLNSRNEPVKVKSIEKVAYSGKIYDVDVENDIVLVRRMNNNNNLNKKNKDADSAASKVMQLVSTDLKNSKNNKYINLSVNNTAAEDCSSSINGNAAASQAVSPQTSGFESQLERLCNSQKKLITGNVATSSSDLTDENSRIAEASRTINAQTSDLDINDNDENDNNDLTEQDSGNNYISNVINDKGGEVSKSEEVESSEEGQENLVNENYGIWSGNSNNQNSASITGNAVAETRNNKKEKGSNGMVKPNQMSPDYDNSSKEKYLNVSENNKKERSQKDVTEMVSNFTRQGINNYNDNNYINLSVDNKNAETAVVTGMVSELPDEQYLLPRRSPSSILGHGVSALSNKKSITGNAVAEATDNLQSTDASQTSTTSTPDLGNTDIDVGNVNNNLVEEVQESSSSLGSEQVPLIAGIDFEDIDGDGQISIGDIVYLDPTLTTITFTLNAASESYNNITYEQNFSHLEVIGDTSSPWRGFNYTTRTSALPYFQDDDNSYGSFDGVNDYVTNSSTLSSSLLLNNTGTISVWVKRATTASTSEYIVFRGTSGAAYTTISYILYLDVGVPELYISNNTISNFATKSITWDTQWHHLLGTWNTTNLIMYVDGVNGTVKTQTLNANQIANHPLVFGTSTGSAAFFNGSIDNVLILNRSLNLTEVSSLYNLGRKDATYTDTSLVSAWRFDNTNISIAQDTIGLNNGTFTNGAQYGYDNSGLVAYYPFDVQENVLNNKTYDYSKNNNDGTLTNTTFNSSCLYGGCYTFNYSISNVKITIGSDLIGINPTTFCAWIYPFGYGGASGQPYGRIIDSGSFALMLYGVGAGTTQKFALVGGSGSNLYSVTNINFNNWQHICAVRNSTGWSWIYINGVADNNSNTGTPAVNTSAFVIGNRQAGDREFNGSIDEVMILNTALNSSQISAIYNNQSQRFKSQGTQTIKQVNITSGYNQVNLTTQFNNYFGSNISARLGVWDVGKTIGTGTAYKDYDLGTHWGEFNGASSYITFAVNNPSIAGKTNASFFAWINQNNLTALTWIGSEIERTSGSTIDWQFFVFNSTALRLRIDTAGGSDTLDASYSFVNNTWYYAGFTYNGTNMTIYINGVAVSSKSHTYGGAITDHDYAFWIGDKSASPHGYFNGSIDEVMIWNKSLSASEISNLYSLGRDIGYYNDASLVSWWGFDNGNSRDKKGSNNGVDTAMVYNQSNALTNGLVSYYHFDEASWNGTTGEVKDAMGLNNGTAQNATGRANTTSSGVYYRGGSFDGVNDYVNATQITVSNYTTLLWVKANKNNPSAYRGLVSGFDGTNVIGILGSGTNNRLIGYVSNSLSYYIDNFDWDDLNWNQLGFSYNGTNGTFYLNGISYPPTSSTNPSDVVNQGLRIGGYIDNLYYFNGTIDEVMIFNRSLTADEVKELYVKGRALWNYTAWQNLSTAGNTYSISTTTTNLLPDFTHYVGNASTNAFYSPNLGSTSATPVGMNVSDTGYPRGININYPANNSNFNTNLSIGFNYTIANTTGDLVSCYWNTNNGANNTLSSCSANTTINLSQGYNNITLYSNDGVDVESASVINILADSVYPTLNISSPVNASYYNNASVLFNVSSSESGTGSIVPNLDNSLVSWWRMDDVNSTGTKVIDYMGVNNGTAVGGASQTDAGKMGKGFVFDGVNDKINTGNNQSLNVSAFTVSGWVKIASNKTTQSFFSFGGVSPTFWFDLGGRPILYMSASNYMYFAASAWTTLKDGNWHYVAVTLNGSEINSILSAQMYLDGSSVSQSTSANSGAQNAKTNFYISNLQDVYTFNGTIDDVLIFNRSLSSTEILALYNATRLSHTSISLADGSHSFTAYTQDLAGNVNSSIINTFSVDTGYPTVNITYPINGTTYSNYVTDINYTISETNPSKCWYGNGSLNYSSVSARTNWTGLTGNSSKGSNTWTVWCNDTTGNLNSTSVTFTVDNTNPTINISSPVNGSNYNNASVLFNVSSSEEGLNGSIVPNLDGSLVSWWRMDDLNSSGGVVDYMGRNNGTAVGGAVQTDAGKMGKGFSFDGVNDYVSLPSSTSIAGLSQVTLSAWVNIGAYKTFDWIYCESTNSVDNARFCVYLDASGNVTLRVRNSTGEPTGTGYNTVSIGGIELNKWYHVVAVYNGINNNGSIYINGVLNSSGSSASGTLGTASTAGIRIGHLISDAQYFNGTIDDVLIFNRSLTASEITSLYNATRLSHTSVALADGSHSFTAYTQDLAGNVNSSTINTFSVDSAYPTVNIAYPINNTYYNFNTVNINYTRSDTNLGSCWYSNDSYSINTTVNNCVNITNIIWSEGQHNVSVWVNDSAGNTNSSSVMFYVDTVLPVVNITYPLNISYNINVSALNYTFTEINAGSCWYSNSSGVWNSSSVSAGTNWTNVASVEGSNTWSVYCNDTAGNVNSSSVTFVREWLNSNITTCRTLDQVNTTYTLINNITTEGTCFTVSANNITIDFNGFNINDTSPAVGEYGVTTAYNQTTVKNGFIYHFGQGIRTTSYNGNFTNMTIYTNASLATGSKTGYGIYITKNNNFISDNNITVINRGFDGAGYGLYLTGSSNNTIQNNILNNNYGEIDGRGIYLTSSSNNQIINNTANSNNYGIYIQTSSNNNFTSNNIWNCTETTTGCIYFLSTSQNNTITGGLINLSLGNLIYLDSNSNNNIFKDLTLLGATKNDTFLTTTSINNTFLNVSYNLSKEYVASGSQLIRKWYYQAYVNDTSGISVSAANVTAFNVSGNYNFNLTTNATGWTQIGNIIDYINTGSTSGVNRTYYSLYTIYTTNSSYPTISHTYNASLGNNLNDLFTLDNVYPNVNITYPLNTTYGVNVSAINYTISETNAGSCWYSNSSGVWNSSSVAAGTNWTGLASVEGSNTWSVYCNDTVGNVNSSSVTFFKDTIYPQIDYGNGTAGNNISVSRNWIYVNVSVAETNFANITYKLFYLNNTGINTTAYTNAVYTINWTGLSDNSYKYNASVCDIAGNCNSTVTRQIMLDTTLPLITINSPVNQTYAVGSILFNATINENGTCRFSLNNGAVNVSMTSTDNRNFNATNNSIADGGYTSVFYCNDSVGNLNSSSVGFTVDTVNPVVNIIYPGDNSYINYNSSVSLNYSIATNNTQACWYSLDSSGNNTINNCLNISLNLSGGNHLIKLWINSSAGLVGSDSVNFTVDLTAPAVNLISPADAVSYTSNLQNVIFNYNITEANAVENCSLIINNNVNMSNSSISNLSLSYNFIQSFAPGTYSWKINCTDVSGNTGNSSRRSFVVSAPAVETPASSGGGGGGAAPVKAEPNLVIDTRELQVPIVINTVKTRKISITNTGNKDMNVNIKLQNISNILSLGQDSFVLAPGEKKDIELKFIGPEDPGIYTGKVLINGQEVLISVNVNTKELLFDAGVVIPDELKMINIGDKLSSQITIVPMGENPRLDVTLNYVIKDFNGRTFLTESETLLIEGQKTFKKEFATQNLPAGNYVLGLELIYPNGVATSTSHFEVAKKENAIATKSPFYIILIALGIGILIFIILTIRIMKKPKMRKPKNISS